MISCIDTRGRNMACYTVSTFEQSTDTEAAASVGA